MVVIAWLWLLLGLAVTKSQKAVQSSHMPQTPELQALLESEAFPHRCHVTSLTAGGSGRLMTASSLQSTHIPSTLPRGQPISSLKLVFLYPALCYFHQLPTKYLSRRVHLNGAHSSYLEPLASRRPLSHNIKPRAENSTFATSRSELVKSCLIA